MDRYVLSHENTKYFFSFFFLCVCVCFFNLEAYAALSCWVNKIIPFIIKKKNSEHLSNFYNSVVSYLRSIFLVKMSIYVIQSAITALQISFYLI